MHMCSRALIGQLTVSTLLTLFTGGLMSACERGAPPNPAAAQPPEAAANAAEPIAGGLGATGTRETSPTAPPVAAVTWREITIPAGTSVPIVLETPVASDTSRVEDPVRAHLSRAIVVDGVTAIPAGSTVSGVVTDVTRAGKVKGTSHVGVRFDTLVPANSDERYRILTAAVGRSGPTQKKKDALEIGAPAAGGAIVGGIIGGKKGAAIGGAAGGGAGTAVVLTQRGEDVTLGKGAAITLRLTEPLTIRVRG